MANPVVQAGANPGELFIPSLNQTITLVEWREDDFYDTVEVPTTPTVGKKFEFFRDIQNKNLQHTNLKTQRNIPSGSQFILTRIGVLLHQANGDTVVKDTDIIKLAYAASLSFKINDRLISEGPVVKYQSGLGVSGSTTQTATGVVTVGVPSAAAAPSLLVAQTISSDDDLQGTLSFEDNAWRAAGSGMPTLSAATLASLYLHGLIKKPATK